MLGFSPIASAPIAARAEFGRTATLAVTEDSDTILATGILPIFGTASITEDNDTASSAGGNFVLGYADITEADDTLATVATLAGIPNRLNRVRLGGYSRISSRMGSA